MTRFTIETRDAAKLPLALDAALRLSGSPQHLYALPADNPIDGVFLAAHDGPRDHGGSWKALPPGAGPDVAAAEIAVLAPDIASHGFRINLIDPPGDPGARAMFSIGLFGT